MKVLMRERDLSDDYIRFAAQIGADGLDIHQPENIPGSGNRATPTRMESASSSTSFAGGVSAFTESRLRRLSATCWVNPAAMLSWTICVARWRRWRRPAFPSCLCRSC